MLQERIRSYYIDGDYNCAEALLLAIGDEYDLNLDAASIRLMAGFGGGMASGKTCGALLGSLSALGALLVETRAHDTPDFSDTCARFVEQFIKDLGSDQCCHLMEKYRAEESRCLNTVELAGQTFERFFGELKAS